MHYSHSEVGGTQGKQKYKIVSNLSGMCNILLIIFIIEIFTYYISKLFPKIQIPSAEVIYTTGNIPLFYCQWSTWISFCFVSINVIVML